jgi:hypothetical protein
MAPSGIEPAAFRLVAQCLNQLRHVNSIALERINLFNYFGVYVYVCIYTGRFIMFSVITNIYNKKTKGPTLMELFTATEKLKKWQRLE